MQDQVELSRNEDGDLAVVVPDTLATSLGVEEGDTLEWRVHQEHAITLHVIDDE